MGGSTAIDRSGTCAYARTSHHQAAPRRKAQKDRLRVRDARRSRVDGPSCITVDRAGYSRSPEALATTTHTWHGKAKSTIGTKDEGTGVLRIARGKRTPTGVVALLRRVSLEKDVGLRFRS